eukprot:743209-Lingulodinium_polyedra.AAC.1
MFPGTAITVCQNIVVFNAVIRGRLTYGLESVSLNSVVKRKLDACQLKGLSKAQRAPATRVYRRCASERVYQMANERLSAEGRTPL